MKLSPETILSLDNLLQTAATVGIDKLVIGDGKIRGIDEKKTVGIVTLDNVPDLDGKTLSVNRIKQLVSRLSLAKAQGDVSITATMAASGTDINVLEVQGGRSKSQFRCAALEAVKGVPKGFNDPLAWEVDVPAKLIPLIAQAEASMTSDGITIASKDGKTVTIELVDTNKDACVFELETDAVGTGDSFCNKYSAKALLSLLREASKTSEVVKLKMGQGGLLLLAVNGFELFTLPQA